MKKLYLKTLIISFFLCITYQIFIMVKYSNIIKKERVEVTHFKNYNNDEYVYIDVNSYTEELKNFKDLEIKRILFGDNNYEIFLQSDQNSEEILKLMHYIKENDNCNIKDISLRLKEDKKYNIFLNISYNRKGVKKQ
ncbi:hypothetical protein [Clostridium polynesiense]|uniref:hypothetical protein n=1 Tax=Clostridium polynesiense TaxID=1325933 RepID=UPI00058BE27D|nr:hypothetical protein [Clostridium polynesiense]